MSSQIEIYFNTTQEVEPILSEYTDKAEKQNERVLEFFKSNPNREMSVEYVYNSIGREREPDSSYGRAITTLTNLKQLIKTDNKVMGSYGRLVCTWKLNQ